MANPNDVVLDQLQIGQYLIEKFTEDLSDAEYFSAPMDGANHAAWILGHIACSEDTIVSLIVGTPQRLLQTAHELFCKGSSCLADASKYPSRKELDELFRNSRANTVEILEAFDKNKWRDPSPEEGPKDMFPTLGALWGLLGTHQFWHIGQLTMCRAAMNKKQILT